MSGFIFTDLNLGDSDNEPSHQTRNLPPHQLLMIMLYDLGVIKSDVVIDGYFCLEAYSNSRSNKVIFTFV